MALFVSWVQCQCSIQHRIVVREASGALYERPEHRLVSCLHVCTSGVGRGQLQVAPASDHPSNSPASTTTARLDVGGEADELATGQAAVRPLTNHPSVRQHPRLIRHYHPPG